MSRVNEFSGADAHTINQLPRRLGNGNKIEQITPSGGRALVTKY